MILITMAKCVCEGRNFPENKSGVFDDREKIISFATELPFDKALERICNYQAAFNKKFVLAVTFRLLSMVYVNEDVSKEYLHSLDVSFVEALPQSIDEFE